MFEFLSNPKQLDNKNRNLLLMFGIHCTFYECSKKLLYQNNWTVDKKKKQAIK